ncbi:hypothetical protein K432DRAFT_75929 [Lepidopterella palustris CBS 459.81]|uniref:Uncharacterized protein n=1 Tax=Lepidopterella palustris CBS 459.81 TaxID=1314670 RepID=A0A8E2JE36_9PEZI|nr:hypothetical protein K432DRAFT_75929 [Lepidopterella palustris CBS 459.81]
MQSFPPLIKKETQTTLELLNSPKATPHMEMEEPLYTEINIPLPTAPALSPPATTTLLPHPTCHRAHTLSTILPFHHRHGSSPALSKLFEESNANASRTSTKTLSALAVLPTVLILSTELFTPGQDSSP